MGKYTKYLLFIIAGVCIVIQFIRPGKNIGNAHGQDEISNVVSVPGDVKKILETSCYDCHSNHTEYPWYGGVQPVGWWLYNHVSEGKEELNFTTFGTYTLKRKKHKLKEIAEEIRSGEMPLSSYVLLHPEAKLTEAQKELLISWAKSGGERIKPQNKSNRN